MKKHPISEIADIVGPKKAVKMYLNMYRWWEQCIEEPNNLARSLLASRLRKEKEND